MASSLRSPVVGALTLLLSAPWAVQDSPELARVGAERATLKALPQAEGSPVLAELLPGTALRVTERREGFVRVVVEGWLASGALVDLPATAAPPAEKPAPPPPPPEPVHDLALAHHVAVTATPRGTGAKRELALTLELRTSQERPVIVEGSKLEGRIRVFAQRRIAGGRVRGDELTAHDVTFEAGRATIVVPFSELGATLPKWVLVSASAVLSAQRTIPGAATDVELAER